MNSPFSPQPSYPLSGESLLVTNQRFKSAENFSEGLALVKVEVKLGRLSENLYGFIDNKGNFAIEPQFDSACSFSEGLAPVKEGISGKYGYIDKTGKFVIQPQFESAYPFFEGIAEVNHQRCIDKKGNFLPFYFNLGEGKFYGEGKFHEGLAVASQPNANGLKGYIDKTGRWVIQPQFKKAGNFSEGLASAYSSEGHCGYIDKTGRWVIQPQYEFSYPQPFSEGLAVASKDFSRNHRYSSIKYGYINKSGNWVVQPQFYAAKSFSEGLAVVQESEFCYFFIDKTGKYWMREKFERFSSAGGFTEGLSMVALGSFDGILSGFTYINKQGEAIVKPRDRHNTENKATTEFSEGLSQFCGGYIDKTGKWIIQPDFYTARNFCNGFAVVERSYGEFDYIRNPLQQQQVNSLPPFFQ